MAESTPPAFALNPQQLHAATFGLGEEPNAIPGPLLIIAGAGSGKTQTLASRVARMPRSRLDCHIST